jgi:hypothetical protein
VLQPVQSQPCLPQALAAWHDAVNSPRVIFNICQASSSIRYTVAHI